FGAQLLEIIDLAVEDDAQVALRRVHRLHAAGQVDDRQTPVSQGETRLDVQAVAVRAAVGDDVGHPSDEVRIERAPPLGVEQARYAAHELISSPCRLRAIQESCIPRVMEADAAGAEGARAVWPRCCSSRIACRSRPTRATRSAPSTSWSTCRPATTSGW